VTVLVCWVRRRWKRRAGISCRRQNNVERMRGGIKSCGNAFVAFWNDHEIFVCMFDMFYM
jgi:hypothetical protein